jgi:hypothetical protein
VRAYRGALDDRNETSTIRGRRSNARSGAPDLLFVPVLGILSCLLIVDPYRINPDCAFYLEGARRLLEGGQPYIDWMDINPPLILYLNLIPATISRYTSVNIIIVFHALVFILILWSIMSIREALLNSGFKIDRLQVGLVLAFWIGLNLLAYHQNDFGQRDHLFILSFAPFFIRRSICWEGGNVSALSSVISGFAASIGACLKPAFLVVPVITEVFGLANHKKRRSLIEPGLITFVCTGVIYGIHFLFLPADVFDYLFNFVMPFTFFFYSNYKTSSIFSILNHKLLLIIVVTNLLPFVTRPLEGSFLWNLARATSILTAGCFLSYLLQGKGFPYHFFPMIGSTCLTAGLILSQCGQFAQSDLHSTYARWILPLRSKNVYRLLVVFTAVIVALSLWVAYGDPKPLCPENPFTKAVAKYSHPKDYVLVISHEILMVWPDLLKTDRRQASRFGTVAGVPLFYSGKLSNEVGRFPGLYEKDGKKRVSAGA